MVSITTWKKDYELGNFEIDTQHKTFLKIIEKLKNTYENKLSDKLLLGYVIELYKYAAYHFISEENYMLVHNYPNYKKHKELHNELLKDLADSITTFNIKYIDIEKLINFSVNWFIKHTTIVDKQIIEFVDQSKNAK